MPFNSITYRVLIASPSDLQEERTAAAEAVNEWNAQHAVAEAVVLLPVRWETHAVPATSVRVQGEIDRQFAMDCDILVGMFWTKLGTPTGVADSGTLEEIAGFVQANKPAMLYFSTRPIDPNRIDVGQFRRLKSFKQATYSKALVGTFNTVDDLRGRVLRDLLATVRELKKRYSRRRKLTKVERAALLTDLMIKHRRHGITAKEFRRYEQEILGVPHERTKAQTSDPPTGAVEPNRGVIGYMPNGDKVEWVKDVDDNGKPMEWPLLLRRNDNAILNAYREFWDKVWWNRHQNWLYRIKIGEERLNREQRPVLELAKKAAKRIERKYGRRNLGWSDFEWGLLSGRMSALAWVMGAEWPESLDT